MVQQLLGFIISNLATLLGITQSIQQQTAHTSQEPSPFYTSDRVFQSLQDLDHPTYGLFALHNQITAIAAQITALGTAVGLDFTTAIAAITTNVKASPAPAWYTPPPPMITPSQVWSIVLPGDTQTTGNRLFEAGSFANNLGLFATFHSPDNPYFLVAYDWANGGLPFPPYPDPDFDLAQLLAGDTVGSWLNRISTVGDVFTLQSSGFWTSDTRFTGYGYWLCTISDADLVAIKRNLGLLATRQSPPVWPGLSNVTLAASHALATGLTITAPMDGVIVAITAVPPGTGLYDFDGTVSYTFVGALSFVSDNGDQEFPQSIGFQSAVYSPREMWRATGVKVRAKAGVVGTVTPWAIT